MKRSLGTVVIAAMLAACQNSADKANKEREDLTKTQVEAQKDISEQRQETGKKMAEAQRDADKEKTEAQRDADKEKMEAQKDLTNTEKKEGEKIAKEQRDVARTDRDLSADNGIPVTVTGKVSDVSTVSVGVKTAAGEDLKLHVSASSSGAPNLMNLHEGDEVRASYKVMGNDKVIQDIKVIDRK